MRIRTVPTEDLSDGEVRSLRRLFDAAWADDPDPFTDLDWQHATGGTHFLAEAHGEIVSHASVVERELHVGDHRLRAGYVEAVATAPAHQRQGHGSAVMRAAGEHIDASFELGALGTGLLAFYERLGWVRWRGPTFVRTASGRLATPEEDGFIFVRLTPRSPQLDLAAAISCEWRPGDVW